MNAANETIVTLTGNVANEPEHRTTQNGATIASFRLACTPRYFDRTRNAWVDKETSFYAVSAFRGLGDHVLGSLRKGDRVVLTGRLRLRAWETDTKSGTTAEVEVDAIGHDLRWGTTTFEKSVKPAQSTPTAWAVPGDEVPHGAGDAPHAGGAASQATQGASSETPAPAHEPELIDAPF